jgi:hypothetical protein
MLDNLLPHKKSSVYTAYNKSIRLRFQWFTYTIFMAKPMVHLYYFIELIKWISSSLDETSNL